MSAKGQKQTHQPAVLGDCVGFINILISDSEGAGPI